MPAKSNAGALDRGRAERVLERGHVGALDGTEPGWDRRELPFGQRLPALGLRVERRLEVLEHEREVEDLAIVRDRRLGRPGTRELREERAAPEHEGADELGAARAVGGTKCITQGAVSIELADGHRNPVFFSAA